MSEYLSKHQSLIQKPSWGKMIGLKLYIFNKVKKYNKLNDTYELVIY